MTTRDKAHQRYSKVQRRVWSDAKFCALSAPQPNGQTLWFRLLTGPEVTCIPGIVMGNDAGLARALGWPLEALREALRELLREGLIRAFDQPFVEAWHEGFKGFDGGKMGDGFREGFLWVPNALKHNKPESPNVIRGWRATWADVPECELKAYAYHSLREDVRKLGAAYMKAFDEAISPFSWSPRATRKPSSKAWPNQEQEQEQEQEQDLEKHSKHAQGFPDESRSTDPDAGAFATKTHRASYRPSREAELAAIEMLGPDDAAKVLRDYQQKSHVRIQSATQRGHDSAYLGFCTRESENRATRKSNGGPSEIDHGSSRNDHRDGARGGGGAPEPVDRSWTDAALERSDRLTAERAARHQAKSAAARGDEH